MRLFDEEVREIKYQHLRDVLKYYLDEFYTFSV